MKPKPKKRALWLQLPRYRRVDRKPEVRRIKRRTTKRAKDERTYNARVKVWLTLPENRICKACPQLLVENSEPAPAAQNHHRYGRKRELLMDERFWLPVCAPCHDHIHRSPALSRELGLLAPLGQWNQMPKD